MTPAEPTPAGADLAHHPFFSSLSDAQVDRVAACAARRTFERGEILFHAGGDADGFFILRRGTVTVENKRPGGGAPSVLQTLHESAVLGWSWLTPPYRWAFDARAVSPVETLFFDGAGLRATFEKDPALGYQIVSRFAGVMGERLRAAHMRMLELEEG